MKNTYLYRESSTCVLSGQNIILTDALWMLLIKVFLIRLHHDSLLLSKYEMLNNHKEQLFPIHYVMNQMTHAFYASSVSHVFCKVACKSAD